MKTLEFSFAKCYFDTATIVDFQKIKFELKTFAMNFWTFLLCFKFSCFETIQNFMKNFPWKFSSATLNGIFFTFFSKPHREVLKRGKGTGAVESSFNELRHRMVMNRFIYFTIVFAANFYFSWRTFTFIMAIDLKKRNWKSEKLTKGGDREFKESLSDSVNLSNWKRISNGKLRHVQSETFGKAEKGVSVKLIKANYKKIYHW